ncbi:MAG: hypothetical protein GWP08_05780, partial [Nitrospiraceae bacterium]|nr:hypothetical protein [Nitrospiraceae bacterium]
GYGYSLSYYQDYGRHWGNYCLYGDMGHLEGCTPESRSAYEHTALVHGLYNVVSDLMRRASAKLPEGCEPFVTANNSDGNPGISWGGHINVAADSRLFRWVFKTKPHVLGMLASFLAAAVNVFGQGFVLRYPNGKAAFVLCSRAHHTRVLVDSSTTIAYKRPLCNSRDENHAHDGISRFHLIPFDTILQPMALLQRTWLLQAFFACLEQGYCNTALLLDNPVRATSLWSRGLSARTGKMEKRCRTANGRKLTSVELLSAITEDIAKYHEAGLLPEEIVPHTAQILPIWRKTLSLMNEGNVSELSKRCDWALMYMILEREIAQRGLEWNSDEIVLTQQLYSHLDRNVGLFWSFLDSGYIERCVDDEMIVRLQHEGPTDTRAYARRAILDKFGDSVYDVDWSEIKVKWSNDSKWSSTRRVIEMRDPAGFTKAEVGAIIENAGTVQELCEALGADDPYRAYSVSAKSAGTGYTASSSLAGTQVASSPILLPAGTSPSRAAPAEVGEETE